MGAAMLDIALLHHPVLNRGGDIIGSAVTNLDVHDIARAARTYGVENYYICTPYEDQRELLQQIVEHWRSGHGSSTNPDRSSALSLIRVADNLDQVIERARSEHGSAPFVVATSAQPQDRALDYAELRAMIAAAQTPVLLLFGTAHGLAPEVLNQADAILLPITGATTYNHLSVRSAVSIILDRLLS